jgi:methionyl-tRNA formyltransferase
MVMTTELDAGPIVRQWSAPLPGADDTRARGSTSRSSRRRWCHRSSTRGPLAPSGPRPGRAPGDDDQALKRTDGWIDLAPSATVVDRRVRALQPWPGAWTTLDGRRLHIRAAHPVAGIDGPLVGTLLPGEWPLVACGQGALALELVQPEGRATMPADAWRRGLPREHVLLGGGAAPE